MQCPMINGQEECKECRKGCLLEGGKCVCHCIIPNCIDCTFENGEKICKKCVINFNLYKGSCKKKIKKKNNPFVVISFLGTIILFIFIVFCCICRIRRSEIRNIPIVPFQGININVDMLNYEIDQSERRTIRKEILGKEFEILKRNNIKVNQICSFCKKNEGKYTCDYGCIVCKEHSNIIKKKEIFKMIKFAFYAKELLKMLLLLNMNVICAIKKN